LGAITYKFYFVFVAFNLLVTLPTIWFVFKVRGIGSFGWVVSANVDVGDESALARGYRLAVWRSCAWNASE
jgi:hypothetical protein